MPFLQARDAFRTEYDLDRPVVVNIVEDPDARTCAGHTSETHTLTISRAAATSGLARELVIHEYAHMLRHEQAHPSHLASTEEAIYLAAGGRAVPPAAIAHCIQIANHIKDIYADDLSIQVTRPDKIVQFLESSLASMVLSACSTGHFVPLPDRTSIAAINAAFALGFVERNNLVGNHHQLYELAGILADAAPNTPFEDFREQFRALPDDPDQSDIRHVLVEAFRAYLEQTSG